LGVRRGETRVIRTRKIGAAKNTAFTIVVSKRDKDVTAHDFNDYYANLLGLSRDERDELILLTQDEEAVERLVRDYAVIWHRRRASRNPDLFIRRSILVRLVLDAAKLAITKGTHTRVEGAYALALCDQIQIYADALSNAETAASSQIGKGEEV
jgi:hypothetical protein